jgi:hypothetical protein
VRVPDFFTRPNAEIDHAARAAAEKAIADRRAARGVAGGIPQPPNVPESQELSIEIHPERQLVEFKTRDRFAIVPTSTFVPFALLEVTFYAVLGLRVAPILASLSAGGSPGPSSDVPPRSANGTLP